jgi:hypothetical protein
MGNPTVNCTRTFAMSYSSTSNAAMTAFNDQSADGWHVVPMGDLRPHESACSCWCNPTPDPEEPRVFIHHSMDRREHTIEKGITQ